MIHSLLFIIFFLRKKNYIQSNKNQMGFGGPWEGLDSTILRQRYSGLTEQCLCPLTLPHRTIRRRDCPKGGPTERSNHTSGSSGTHLNGNDNFVNPHMHLFIGKHPTLMILFYEIVTDVRTDRRTHTHRSHRTDRVL